MTPEVILNKNGIEINKQTGKEGRHMENGKAHKHEECRTLFLKD